MLRLFRELWATSPWRGAVVVCLVVLGAAGQVAAAAAAGPVLVDRSVAAFLILAIALAIGVLGEIVVALLAARLTADWAAGTRDDLCRVAFGQKLPTLESTPVGELLDRIDGDVSQVASEVRGAGVRIMQSVVVGALSIAVALVVWWPAGLAMIAVCTLLALWLRAPVGRISAARIREEEAWSDLAAVMEEAVHGQDDVRTTLAQPYVIRLYVRRSAAVLRLGRRVWTMSARLTATASGVSRAGIAALVIGGGWALTTGRMDGARLTAIWLLALGFGATVEHISRIVPELQHALGAWSRVLQLKDAEQEPLEGAEPAGGDLRVTGLTFHYGQSGERPVLRDVNLAFTRGKSYALIGRTGSGKSTLVKILTRAVDVPRGTVYLAGTDIVDLDVEQLRRTVAVVPQRTDIIAGSLEDNLTLFDPSLAGRVAGAIEQLELTEWVANLPDRLRTRLGDGGHVLSAGQEQLVAFARILTRAPGIVILDEATARLDPITEATVQRATERLLRGRIGIVIAHRLSTVQNCDEVVILADGRVVEQGPLGDSERFARLLSAGGEPVEPVFVELTSTRDAQALGKVEPPPLPEPQPARTLREIFRLITNDPRFGLAAIAMFCVLVVFGLDGAVLPWQWANLVDGAGGVWGPVAVIVAALLITAPATYFSGRWFPEWWVRQMLRINLRLVRGQTGPRQVSRHTPAEVIAQGGDNERVVILADNLIDQMIAVIAIAAMTVISRSIVPALFFAGTMVVSGLAAAMFGTWLSRAARVTVAARAAFATALASCLTAARTIKLAGASRSVLGHLARLDGRRNELQRKEISIQVWARSAPAVLAGLLPIAVWAMFLAGTLTSAATLVAVSTLGAARWFAWTTASLLSQLPSAKVWTRRTVDMAGVSAYSKGMPGVDLSAGTAPAPPVPPRRPLRNLRLSHFTAVHEDGTVAATDINLTVHRGELVLVLGPVGSGKSSLLRALAGIVHHTGDLLWNGEPVTDPQIFLRPQQVGYVSQLPRVFSGSIADNIALDHHLEAETAVSTAQLDHDLAATDSGLGLVIGHKGTRLSGGQLQRLALARALAPRTELLIADDISSALDVTTELALWRAIRDRGVTVIGSTSKRAALRQADKVLVLIDGRAAALGSWQTLEPHWGHLAG